MLQFGNMVSFSGSVTDRNRLLVSLEGWRSLFAECTMRLLEFAQFLQASLLAQHYDTEETLRPKSTHRRVKASTGGPSIRPAFTAIPYGMATTSDTVVLFGIVHTLLRGKVYGLLVLVGLVDHPEDRVHL